MDQKTENKNSSSQFLKIDRGNTKSNAIEMPSIPLPVSQARGTTPALNLSYYSGRGCEVSGAALKIHPSAPRSTLPEPDRY